MGTVHRATLVFDILGTLVDERGSIRDELARLLDRHRVPAGDADPDVLADAWLAHLGAELDRIRDGRSEYAPVDAINRTAAASVLGTAGLRPSDDELDRLGSVGHRLRPWPDSVSALDRLARDHTLIALSNANRSMLVDLLAGAGLRFHLVVSGEEVGAYKPDPAVYRRVSLASGRRADELTMVAAHAWDLRGAAAVGMRTVYVDRPGADRPTAGDSFDRIVDELAALGAGTAGSSASGPSGLSDVPDRPEL